MSDETEANATPEQPEEPSAEAPAEAGSAPEAASDDGGGGDDLAAQALKAAQAAASAASDPEAKAVSMPAFDPGKLADAPEGIDLLSDVNLDVTIELGRTRMYVEDVLKLAEGAVVELDKLAGDPVDIYVNQRHVARGEVLILNDNFCVRVNEIVESGAEAAAG